jgi:glutaconate CoA-transferase, subunit A
MLIVRRSGGAAQALHGDPQEGPMNKVTTLEALVEQADAAGSLAFGGGGIVRKPLAAAAALAASNLTPKPLYALLGGPEVDLMIGLGKISHLTFAYIGMDSVGLAPNFRRARESGSLPVTESSEYLFLSGLEASARAVPFLPTRSGLGTDVLTRPNTPYVTFSCPISAQTLVAAPAIRPELAVIHVNVADVRGNCVVYGEIFGDFLLARAAESVWVTAEKVVGALPPLDSRPAGSYIPRLLVDAVIEAPGGAGFTGIYPDYPQDREAAAAYRDHAADPAWLKDFIGQFAAPARAGAL